MVFIALHSLLQSVFLIVLDHRAMVVVDGSEPVRKEDREGQHMGVEVKAFLKLAPPSRRIFIVLGMNSNEPGRGD